MTLSCNHLVHHVIQHIMHPSQVLPQHPLLSMLFRSLSLCWALTNLSLQNSYFFLQDYSTLELNINDNHFNWCQLFWDCLDLFFLIFCTRLFFRANLGHMMGGEKSDSQLVCKSLFILQWCKWHFLVFFCQQTVAPDDIYCMTSDPKSSPNEVIISSCLPKI